MSPMAYLAPHVDIVQLVCILTVVRLAVLVLVLPLNESLLPPTHGIALALSSLCNF